MQELLTPQFGDYELIDSGNFEKLERFGRYVARRPEPQAIWRPSLGETEWSRLADASFLRDARSDEHGQWRLRGGMPSRWTVDYAYKRMCLRMRLGLTSFKHVGLFPEQAANWNFIYDNCRMLAGIDAAEDHGGGGNAVAGNGAGDTAADGSIGGGRCALSSGASASAAFSVSSEGPRVAHGGVRTAGQGGRAPRVLNLFAYTGGATLAARAGGAEVTHVDSVRQVVTWARENMEQSGLDGVRWIVEDALKFVQREVRRGSLYEGIILDPPAYGRGANGEKWILEDNIGEMLEACAALLAPENAFLVLNLYSMGLSSTLARTAVRQTFGAPREEQWGELCFTDRGGKQLPLGTYYRFTR